MTKHLRIILVFLGAMLGLSASAQTVKEWRDSLESVNRMLVYKPKSVELHLRKAGIQLQLEQWEYAINEYTDILAVSPTNVAAHYFRAFAHNQLRHYELAKNDYEDILATYPRHLEARLGLAYTFIKLDKSAEAMSQMNLAVEQCPDSAVAYASRAGLERELKQYPAALYDWQEALRLAPTNTDYAVSRIDILLLLGRKEEAKAALDDLVKGGIPRGLLREWYAKCR